MSEENGIQETQTQELAVREDRQIAIARYVTPVGLEGLPDDLEQERWADLLAAAKNYADAQYWIAGDLANFGEAHYGEAYSQFVDVMGYDPGTLTAAMYVARTIRFEERRPELSWSCHQVVAGIKDPEQRKAWLGLAADNKWTREELRTNIRETQGREKKRGKPKGTVQTKKGKVRKQRLSAQDFTKLVNKELEPALKKGIKHCEQFVKSAEKLMADLDKGKTDQSRFEDIAKALTGFGEDLGPLGHTLVATRDMVQAIADYEPEPEPKPKKKAGRPKGVKSKKKAEAQDEQPAAE
jgi:hypothetical protein